MKNNITDNYKQTKIGIIPKDWEVVRLREISQIDKKSLNNSTNKDYKFNYISLSDINNGKIKTELSIYKFENAPSRARRVIKKSDILLATVRPNLQAFAYIENEVTDTIVSTGFAVISSDNCKVNSKFVYYNLFSHNISGQIYSLVVGSNYPAINSSDVKNLNIPLPPLPEQEAIAQILSTWDEAIQHTQQLLQKLQIRKKGLMQQLLTAKTRLKGFSEEWKEVKLGEVGKIMTGNTPSTKDQNNYGNEFCFVSPADISEDKYIINTIKMLSELGFSKSRVMIEGSILFVCIGSTIGKIAIAGRKLTSNQQINSITVNSGYNNEFIYYSLLILNRKIKLIAAEQAVPIINKSSFSKIRIKTPTLEEQTAIAAILSAADTEIKHYKTYLAQLQAQKKGLMQQLLTGKKRVNFA